MRGGFPESYLAADDTIAMDWLEDLIRTYLEWEGFVMENIHSSVQKSEEPLGDSGPHPMFDAVNRQIGIRQIFDLLKGLAFPFRFSHYLSL